MFGSGCRGRGGARCGGERRRMSSRSEVMCGTRLGGFFFPVRRGGGGAESLSELGCRLARLDAPRLEGFTRCLGCKWSIERSLEESERLALEEAVERNVRKIESCAGGCSDVSLMREHSALISEEISPCRRCRPSEASAMASRKVHIVRAGGGCGYGKPSRKRRLGGGRRRCGA